MGFVIYDVETSGRNPRFDQILQFAAVLTDDDLKPLDQVNIHARLRPNVIPSPEALQVNGLKYADLICNSRPSHYEAVCEIHAVLSRWSPTTFLGFNSIRFDEEFLRQAFYQCLHPLFVTNSPGNARGDVLKLARAVASLHPEVIAAPIDATGRRVFRLSELARVNGFGSGRAHDALADVHVTLDICRRVKEGAPDVWSNFNRFSNKNVARDFVRDEEAFGLFQSYRGHQDAYCVTAIGLSPTDGNAHYCLDLTCDVDALRRMSHEELVARFATDPRPIHKVKVNASPLLCAAWELGPTQLGDFVEADLAQEAARIRSDPDFQRRLVAAAAAGEPVYPPAEHVEQEIYGGDYIQNDQWDICREFHAAPWEHRQSIANRLSDTRLRRLAKRLLLFERPDLLEEVQRRAWEAEVHKRLCAEEERPWLTIPAALRELDKLNADPNRQLDLSAMAQLKASLQARLDYLAA